jgi:hypothetical protein
MTDIVVRIKDALKNSEFWTSKTKDNGRTIFPLKCPACGKMEAWAHSAEPWSINCNRMKNCGERTKTQELFPEILIKIEQDFKPTSEDPNRPAAAYLQMRGLSESLKDLPFEYWRDVRRTGKGAVMFPIDKEKTIWNGRLFDPPAGEGKTHNVGSTAGVVWRHPGIKYATDEETFVVEGILDALSLIEMGFQAVSVLAAGQDPASIDLSEFKRITFAFDNDPAGHKALRKWMDHFSI